jgi:mono/diheme cytochrome c family protein
MGGNSRISQPQPGQSSDLACGLSVRIYLVFIKAMRVPKSFVSIFSLFSVALLQFGVSNAFAQAPVPIAKIVPGQLAPAPAPAAPANNVYPLAFDSVDKTYHAKPEDRTNVFRFTVTNISQQEVFINALQPSCGCTVAQLPSVPWKLEPGKGGEISATMDFSGKTGELVKSVVVHTSHGPQTLILRVNIPLAAAMTEEQRRARNQQLASVDRQTVFRGDCASCHVTPTIGKHGEELYKAACGICHDAEHRASIVPSLAALQHPTDANFWRHWISEGKPGSLMPAFSAKHGGPLNDGQIESLVQYLVKAKPGGVQPQQKPAQAHSPEAKKVSATEAPQPPAGLPPLPL